MEVYFTDEEMTIPQLEEYKWEMMQEGSFESAMYALYLQQRINEIMTGIAQEIILKLSEE